MNNSKFVLSVMIVLVALVSEAAAPVAMRVEVEPLGSSGEMARVAVIVQVSPEDRGRIGKSPIVRIKLDGEVPRGQSPMWAVRMGSDGSARVETEWPPGEHDLKVEIEDPSGVHRGVWVGLVRIPGSNPEPTAVPPTPTPSQIPTPPVIPTPTVAVPTPVPEAEIVDEPEAAPATVAAVAVADATAQSSAEPSVPTSDSAASLPEHEVETAKGGEIVAPATPEPVPEPETVVSSEVESAEVSATVEPEDARVSDPEPELEPEPEPETAPEPEQEVEAVPAIDEDGESGGVEPVEAAVATAGAVTAASVSAEEPATGDSPSSVEEPIVEPLRSPEPAPTTEPLRAETLPEVDRAAVAEPVETASPEVRSAIEAWQDAAPGTSDLTVIVSRNRLPAQNLQPNDLSLEIGESPVAIEGIGDAGDAPLLVGFAVDLSPAGLANWSQIGRMLGPLVQRADGGRGRLFAATSGETTDWDASPGRLDEMLPNPTGGDLTGLIDGALANFGEQRGRSFLILITDGRTNPTKEAWKETRERIAEAGVPVLVIALWDEDFSNKVRRSLQDLAASSGGRLFQVLGVDQLDSAVDRYGPVLDSGVALRFQTPERSKPGPAQVSVKAANRSLDVSAPKTIR